MNVLAEYREFRAWRERRRERAELLAKLCALELAVYTAEQCFGRVADAGFPSEDIGPIGVTLFARSGRGELSIEEALARFHDKPHGSR